MNNIGTYKYKDDCMIARQDDQIMIEDLYIVIKYCDLCGFIVWQFKSKWLLCIDNWCLFCWRRVEAEQNWVYIITMTVYWTAWYIQICPGFGDWKVFWWSDDCGSVFAIKHCIFVCLCMRIWLSNLWFKNHRLSPHHESIKITRINLSKV